MTKPYILGFDYQDSISPSVDYEYVRVILQSISHTSKYNLTKDEPYKFSNDSVSSLDLNEGIYKRFYIGYINNKESVIKQDLIKFDPNPETSFLKIGFYSQMVKNIEEYLTNPKSVRYSSYSIAGRSINTIPFTELTELREKYKRKADLELRGVNHSPSSIFLRF